MKFSRLSRAMAVIGLLSQFSAVSAAAATFSGTVVGATLEVSGATVTVFSTNSGGAIPVGSGTSDSSGNFSFSFSNPGGNNVLYAIATGGDVGHGLNPAIAMMAVLGTGANSAPSVNIDEITTIASIWSMAQFIQSDGSISGPSPGLENAAATVPSLSYLPAGLPSHILTSTLYNTPTKLNSLADILVPCIESAGPSSTQCAALFLQATPQGGVAPNNTLQAAENIARHPTANVANLFTISSQDQVFGPALTQPPPAWTLSVQYGGGGLAGPISVAVDGNGNVWAGNIDGVGGLTKMGPGGVADAGSPFLGGGLNSGRVTAVALDGSGHVWAANSSIFGTVSELDSNGTPISPDGGYPTSAGEDGRFFGGIAVDPSGDIWLTDSLANSVVKLSPNGDLLSPPGDFKRGGLDDPTGIAADSKGRVWVANNFVDNPRQIGSVSAFDSAGHPISPKRGYTRGGIGFPIAIAIDAKENVWIADLGYLVKGKLDSGGATKLNSKGAPLSKRKGFQTGGIFEPDAIAIDGAGDVWLVDNNNSNAVCPVSELNPKGVAISPPSGYVLDGFCDAQHSIAIDGSGNIWIANTGISTLIEMVGAASPVEK